MRRTGQARSQTVVGQIRCKSAVTGTTQQSLQSSHNPDASPKDTPNTSLRQAAKEGVKKLTSIPKASRQYYVYSGMWKRHRHTPFGPASRIPTPQFLTRIPNPYNPKTLSLNLELPNGPSCAAKSAARTWARLFQRCRDSAFLEAASVEFRLWRSLAIPVPGGLKLWRSRFWGRFVFWGSRFWEAFVFGRKFRSSEADMLTASASRMARTDPRGRWFRA